MKVMSNVIGVQSTKKLPNGKGSSNLLLGSCFNFISDELWFLICQYFVVKLLIFEFGS